MQVSTARRAARPPPANTKPSHRHLLLGSFLLCPFSQVEDLIVAWAAAEPSPFNSSASGYMTTEEVRASLEAALSAGDVEGADDEQPPDEHAVEAALLALQQRQQDLQEPLGLLSRQRLGIGRLWRIIPPNEDDAAAASATLSRKLALLVNAESVTEAERLSAEALDASSSFGGMIRQRRPMPSRCRESSPKGSWRSCWRCCSARSAASTACSSGACSSSAPSTSPAEMAASKLARTSSVVM
jgi:hypothetical protein